MPTHHGETACSESVFVTPLCCDAGKDTVSSARGFYIPGSTEPPMDAAYTNKSSKQAISLIVFVMEEQDAWAWTVHDDLPAYCRKHNLSMPPVNKKHPSSVNALEVEYAIRAFLEHCKEKGITVETVVMDRATWHRKPKLITALKKLKLKPVLLPPRSHELSPLDNGFFGVVDSTWDRWRRAHPKKTWQQKKKKLLQIVRAVKPGPFVRAWVENILKMVVCEGKRWLKP